MIKINYLGWDPYTVFSAVGINYAGNVTTKAEQKYVTKNMYQIPTMKMMVMIQDFTSIMLKVMQQVPV